MKPTNLNDPEYFHKVVDCQYACPAHTPVPEYIRLIADEKYTEAYMINWESNVFPGILGRTCDRPCEPACRRGRVEEKPVAICRLKRVAADNKGDVKKHMPKGPFKPNGKKVALIGGGPASLTVARDLAPLGYEIHLYDEWHKGGGMMRTQIPAFRLPEEVLDEEVNYVLDLGIKTHFNHFVHSMKDEILSKDYDAVFVGTGAPSGRKLNLPGFEEAGENIHIGIEFLANVAFEHKKSIGKKVIVLGGGNTAMDCCRTSRRIGGEDVKVIVRSPFKDMKASPWEIEDAQMEDIPIMNNMPPKEFVVENGKLKGVIFGKVYADYSSGRRKLIPTGEPDVFIEADDVIIAIGQDNAFPWIERDLGIEFGKWDIPVLDKTTFQSTLPKVFFGGDAAFGPENVITAAAHGHQAAVSIHLFCEGQDLVADRPDPMTNLYRQKMGIHEWMYDSPVVDDLRYKVGHEDKKKTLRDRKVEVELGFTQLEGFKEAQRCLNCDVMTVFDDKLCIECDACMDVCPTDCITFTKNGEEEELRPRLRVPALNESQDLYVSEVLPTTRVMIKDEDVCLHCGLCAERCPTAAWDMQKYMYSVTKTYEMEGCCSK